MIYRGVIKVKQITENYVIIETKSGQDGTINLDKIPSTVIIGDTLQHCEHGFYDIIDDDGNYIFRHLTKMEKPKRKKWWQFWL